jgi:RecB family endonuclease NucS
MFSFRNSLVILKDDGTRVYLKKHTWKSVKYNSGNKSIKGYFIQYPLIRANAINAVNARGVMFESLHIDITDLNRLSDYISDWVTPKHLSVSEATKQSLQNYLEHKNIAV